ncbi:MAG: DUF3168 domain-containing protein [Burkholderiaceae bacterium]|nr:DUF3168 domain-containing protein [Burkholderiaceae bacterium]
MSAEAELRALLVANGALLGLVPAARISLDAVDQSAPRPYIVLSKQSATPDFGLDNTLFADQVTIDIQCVGTNRRSAIAVGDAVVAALQQAGEPHSARSAAYDADNDLEVEVVTVDWFLT